MIEAWRRDLRPHRQADMDVFLRGLVTKSEWAPPDVKPMLRNPSGFWELRWKGGNFPHRIGGYYAAPKEFVMLIGWTHKDNVYNPPEALESLKDRKGKLLRGEGSLCEYEIFTGRRAKK